MINITFVQILEFVGTLAFAISGIRLASAKHFDLFGAYIVGLLTAIGGGTMRDIMLDIPIFWMADPFYLICTALALVWVMIFGKYLIRQNSTWFIFDTIGLGMFTVTGIEKTLMQSEGYPFWTAVIMGTITGAAGGVLRDVFRGEVPLIFRKEIYALACVVGGIGYYICLELGMNHLICGLVCDTCVIIMRILAVRYGLHLPILKGEEDYK